MLKIPKHITYRDPRRISGRWLHKRHALIFPTRITHIHTHLFFLLLRYIARHPASLKKKKKKKRKIAFYLIYWADKKCVCVCLCSLYHTLCMRIIYRVVCTRTRIFIHMYIIYIYACDVHHTDLQLVCERVILWGAISRELSGHPPRGTASYA